MISTHCQTVFINRSRQLRQCGKPQSFIMRQRGKNSLCGDEIVIYIMNLQPQIHWQHECHGCSVCLASLGWLEEILFGKNYQEILAVLEDGPMAALDQSPLGTCMRQVIAAKNRHKCVRLPWETLQLALEEAALL